MRRVTQRKRLWLAVAAVAVLLFAVGGYFVYDHYALRAEERNLVGRWVQTREGMPTYGLGLIVEFEVRENRTVLLVNRDEKTGEVTYANLDYGDWRLRNGVLTLGRWNERGDKPWFIWWKPRAGDRFEELRLEPDGPDRYRYTVVRLTPPVIALPDPLPTGTWTRVGAK